MSEGFSTFETDQPWVVYHYGLSHDGWWPLWNSTRITGRAKVVMECAVCGEQDVARMRIPGFGKITDRGHHPIRVKFLADHQHLDRGSPMSWAKPLLNPDAHPRGIDLEQLAMRLEADINEKGSRA